MKYLKNAYSSACGAYAGLLDHRGKIRARNAVYRAAPNRSKARDAFDLVTDTLLQLSYAKGAFMSAWEGLIDWADFWHITFKRRG
jgi:hypothetical protein